MRVSELRVGDRIKINAVPGRGDSNYYLHSDTKRVYKKLMARQRSVRIREIDEFGTPWYTCRFKRPNGTWERHSLAVCDSDNNWARVARRNTQRGPARGAR